MEELRERLKSVDRRLYVALVIAIVGIAVAWFGFYKPANVKLAEARAAAEPKAELPANDVAADAETARVAGLALPETLSGKQIRQFLVAQAKTNVIDIAAIDVTDNGDGTSTVGMRLDGSWLGLLSFLDGLNNTIRVENGQLRGEGPLFIVRALKISTLEGTSSFSAIVNFVVPTRGFDPDAIGEANGSDGPRSQGPELVPESTDD